MQLPKERRDQLRIAAVIAAIAAGYALWRAFAPDVDVEELLGDISRTLGEWTYVLVFILALLETGAFVGLVAPGETFVVLGGAVAGQGETSLLLTIALAWSGAFLGDTASFVLGAKLGRGFVLEHGERVRITRERFAQVEAYFERHGGKTILIGRFIGIIRALAPFIAGSSGMRYSRMAPFSILGTGIWATFFSLLGYVASRNVHEVLEASERGFFLFGVTVVVVVGGILAFRFLRVPGNRRRLEAGMRRRPWLRPLLRLVPQIRFLWGRLTPGGLGIELTAPVAALAVGSFVFASYAIILGGDPGPTGGDREAADLAAELRAGWLTSVAEAVTRLGDSGVVIAVAAVAVVVFAARGNWEELGITVVALGALAVVVPELKEAIDRPRPEAPLADADGRAYPSGHAAYSALYTWLAVAVTVRLRPAWQGGTALLIAGIVLSAAIGLSRVYLGVHWMSDVSGGWGLGVCAFALAAAGAVVVSYLRNNSSG